MSNSMTDVESTFGRGLTKTTQDILKQRQQNQLEELESLREKLKNYTKNSEQVPKNDNSNKLTKRFLINFLKLSIIIVIITGIILMIIFALSNI
jgi:cytoskeletal protein RodZ